MSTWSSTQINTRLDILAHRVRITLFGEDPQEWAIAITAFVGIFSLIGMIAFTSFVIESHADGYRAADVPAGQAAAGAAVAQVFVAASNTAAFLLFRAGRATSARTLVGVSGGLLLLFTILPNVVGGSSWLTTFLAVLTALLLHLLVGVVVGFILLLARPDSSPEPETPEVP